MAHAIVHGVKTLGIVGGGQMGLGIAYVAALSAKVPVLLHDRSEEQISKSLKLMDKLLAKDVAKGKIQELEAKEARERVSVVGAAKGLQGLRDVDMVIEAVSESLPLKQTIFSSLSRELRPEAILATNTSSISITKIAASTIPEGETSASPLGQRSAGRVVGLHFFNPVPVMKLVEIISALQTSEETLGRARAFALACGKQVTTSKDVPGFVSNALLMPFINEAIMCLEQGVATKEDIDKTLKLGMNHPMGPLQLADFIGLDTCLAIQQTLYKGTGDSKYRPSVLLERMVDAQWYGKKNGKGFYDYKDDDVDVRARPNTPQPKRSSTSIGRSTNAMRAFSTSSSRPKAEGSPEPKYSALPSLEPRHPFTIYIADDAKTAEQLDESDKNTVQIYTDGSVRDGKAGAAAVLLRKNRQPRILRLHLGSNYFSYEAEVVGVLLGLHLLCTERKASRPVSMACDNQSAIRALLQPEGSRASASTRQKEAVRKLAGEFVRVATGLKKGWSVAYSLLVRWVPGHGNVEGNKMADAEAIKAAEGKSSPDAELPTYLVERYRHKPGTETKPKPKKQ